MAAKEGTEDGNPKGAAPVPSAAAAEHAAAVCAAAVCGAAVRGTAAVRTAAAVRAAVTAAAPAAAAAGAAPAAAASAADCTPSRRRVAKCVVCRATAVLLPSHPQWDHAVGGPRCLVIGSLGGGAFRERGGAVGTVGGPRSRGSGVGFGAGSLRRSGLGAGTGGRAAGVWRTVGRRVHGGGGSGVSGHAGKRYYVNRITGTTQWEAPA
mmetsp:Transcript_49804/g.161053  ORF Transcript_49804/g.161053 Transcript_49804/m.161053 type:complete len:208 (+) Transcript_49804:743-1366(+)